MLPFLEEFEEFFSYFVGSEGLVGHRDGRIDCLVESILSPRDFDPLERSKKLYLLGYVLCYD